MGLPNKVIDMEIVIMIDSMRFRETKASLRRLKSRQRRFKFDIID